jgi:iron complex transport system ATP-binding protein
MGPLIRIQNLWVGYPNQTVIKGVSLDVKRGEFLVIIGPNGSGKTTLLRAASKVLAPLKGSIFMEDKDISRMKPKEFCRKAAFVAQDTLINFSFSAWEIALMGRIPHLGRLQSESKTDFDIVENALTMTDTGHLKSKDINHLSSGERQRVIIAKALAQQPALLFLYEPTSHLDIGHQIQILDLLKRFNRQNNLTVIMVMHDLNLACEYASRLVLLNDGMIFKEGAPEEVLTYQNIESVYKTIVVVGKNPVSAKPFVISVSKER